MARRTRKLKKKSKIRKTHMNMRRIRKENPEVRLCDMHLKNIPKDLRDKFNGWCKVRGYTAVGKIRQFMYDAITGKIK